MTIFTCTRNSSIYPMQQYDHAHSFSGVMTELLYEYLAIHVLSALSLLHAHLYIRRR